MIPTDMPPAVTVHHGDCIDVLPTLGPVDAIVTDPPYHLLSTVKRFGQPNSAPPTSAAHGRLARGFMGQQWDGGDIAFRPETWATIGAALKPGGYLLAFGGTRTWHRLACAIEDAGFVIQDTIAWVYGSGFPKNKALLKPAYEPIVMAYKPGGKRALQIDECRIGTHIMVNPPTRSPTANRVAMGQGWGVDAKPTVALGRWPANLCHDGSDEVLALFPAEAPNSYGHGYDAGFLDALQKVLNTISDADENTL
jgi:site-specific DNA-methyltransferase (adenine-specific)